MLVKNVFIISLILIHPRTDHQMKNEDYEEVNLDIEKLKPRTIAGTGLNRSGVNGSGFGGSGDVGSGDAGIKVAGPGVTGSGIAGSGFTGHGVGESGISGSGHGGSGTAGSVDNRPGGEWSGSTGSGDDTSEEAVPGDVESDEAESGDDESEEAGSGDDESEEAGSGDDKSEEAVSGDDESDEAESGDDVSEEAGSGDDESEEAGSGDDESEEAESGDDESESEDDEDSEDGSDDDESEEDGSEDDESKETESEPECHCNTFVNSHGLGNCKKHDDDFGSPSCFVNIPSDCNDLIESRINRGMFRSGEACRSACLEEDTNYLLNDIVDINEADITMTWEECSKLCNTKYCHCNYWTWYKEEGICLVKTKMKEKARSNLTISGNRKCGSKNVLNSASMWTKHEKRHCYKKHGGEESAIQVIRHEELFIRLDDCKDKCKNMLTCEGISVQHGKEGENKTVCYLKQKINVDKCLNSEEWDVWIFQRKCSDQEKNHLENKNKFSGFIRPSRRKEDITSPNGGSEYDGSGGGASGNAESGFRKTGYDGSGQPNVTRNCECGKVNRVPVPKYDPTLNYERCSVSQDYHRRSDFRISGGANTLPHQYPFMTHVYLENNMCGGALISNKHILTAYHCVAQYVEKQNFIWTNKSYIQLGGHNRKRRNEFIRYFIKDCKFPPGIAWNPHKRGYYDHDIAILVLKTYVKFTSFISPICLPQPNEIIDMKVKVIAIGWGNICDNPKAPTTKSHELKHVQTELSDINIYRPFLKSKYPFNKLTNFLTTIVPILEEKLQKTGSGDSGGPLIQRIKDTDLVHYKLIGDTSANLNLINGTNVGVYGAIVPFIGWIKQTVAAEPESYMCGAN